MCSRLGSRVVRLCTLTICSSSTKITTGSQTEDATYNAYLDCVIPADLSGGGWIGSFFATWAVFARVLLQLGTHKLHP